MRKILYSSILCKCGCGEFTKQGNKYILGHNSKDRVVLEETRQKISEKNKGRISPMKGKKPWNKGMTNIFSDETREKWSKNRKGENNPFYGKNHSDEFIEKQRQRNTGKTPGNKGKKYKNTKGRNKKAKWLKFHRKNNYLCFCGCDRKIRIKSIHYKEGIPKFIKGHNPPTEQQIQNIKKAIKELWNDSEYRAKQIGRMKDLWTQQGYRDKVIKNSLVGLKVKPNKAELKLQDIIDSITNTFTFVGNGKKIVGSKCPDFIDPINNKIIELYGDYWHRGQDPNDRINYFKNYGYDTLVIWEAELKDTENIKKKLMGFLL